MKHIISTRFFVATFFALLILACQPKKPKVHYDAETFVPSYKLIIPDNWTIERFGIPIEFAPSIPYNGIEDLRFAPGWDNINTDDYWSYSYLWYLDGKVDFSAKTIEDNLESYYTGLVGRNVERRKIPKAKVFPVKATFEVVQTHDGDSGTFYGTVYMLDYMAQQPITLNCLVHVRECPGKDITFIYFEISPRVSTHLIWQTLGKTWTEFRCDAK